MGFIQACKAFLKAWGDPAAAKRFLDGEPKPQRQAAPASDQGHLRLLAMLQQSSRLVDFFKEDLTGCSDAQVGAAVRKIHEDCRKKLEELVTIRPIFEESEGSRVQIAAGYDPAAIKLVGKVKSEPPFTGVLVHKGWKAHKRSLPKSLHEQENDVLCPAEIEV
jgi:hypothetical protein